MWALLVLYCFVAVGATGEYSAVLNLRGGLVPQAGENGEDYYEQFTLDYGCEDNVRIAGSMRGLIKSGRLAALPESDPFLKVFKMWTGGGVIVAVYMLHPRSPPAPPSLCLYFSSSSS
mmetsp:Transcript_28503/g.63180  ORF Transcript_28503/g.63180 Transcript_28503/m.63180 type:complete len:118 (+) Transcript_28503:167-520(+)